MLQRPFLYHSSFGIFYTAHHDKCVGIDLYQFSIQFIQFKTGNNGKDDINIFCFATFAKTFFATVQGYPSAHLVDDHLSYLFAMRGGARRRHRAVSRRGASIGRREIGRRRRSPIVAVAGQDARRR